VQCLQNLVVNTVKYRGQSNWVGISAELCQDEGTKDEIRITVADRGVGICDSELERIFEPFYRSPETLASHVQSTGLGFTVALRSVMEMDGKLTVSRVLGAGSIFSIQLPVADEALLQESISTRLGPFLLNRLRCKPIWAS
jgi:signal transduction histidine kinase